MLETFTAHKSSKALKHFRDESHDRADLDTLQLYEEIQSDTGNTGFMGLGMKQHVAQTLSLGFGRAAEISFAR